MKNRCNLLGITVIAIVTIFVSLACQNPANQPPKPATGSITGKALFTNSADNSGITITLEQSEGLRSVAAINANRSIAEGALNARALSIGARSVTAAAQTATDGSYTLRDIPAGTYTLYASSQNSLEKAVTKNITVQANNVFDAGTLNLTPVGAITGQIILDNGAGSPLGFLVSVAGTSFMAATGSDGRFTISGIPAGSGYYLIVMRGNYTAFYTETVQSVSGGQTTTLQVKDISSVELAAGSEITISDDGYWVINGEKTNVRAQGTDGRDGEDGKDGADGKDGEDGKDGADGKDGTDGKNGEDGKNGADGKDGVDGKDGKDGENGATGPAGPQGPQGNTGPQGPKGDPGNMLIERVSFTGLTANGDADTTTTRLTLSFSADLTGLSSNDITIIDNGNTGAVVGPLTRTGEGVYNLIVYGVNAPGEINVVVSKIGYILSPVYQSVSLYYNANSTPSFTNINDMADWLQAAPANSRDAPYHITLSGLNLESDLMVNTDPLRKLFDVLNGRFVALDMRGCTGESLPNIVSASIAGNRSNQFRLVSIQLPDSITYIGDYVFYCSNLTSVTLPASLTAIGDYAFLSNAAPGFLTSITLPDSLISIGNDAFSGCRSLISVTLPASLTAIGNGAFYECTSLISVTLPASLTSIGDRVFGACPSPVFAVTGSGQFWASGDGIMLMQNTTVVSATGASGSVTIPDGITSIRDYAFSGCSGLTSVTLPDSVATIGDYAFSRSGLTSVTLSVSLTSIGDYAFSQCGSLASVTLPNSVTSIGERAFQFCNSLTSVTLSASLTSIGTSAFTNCSSLLLVTCNAVSPPEIGNGTFGSAHANLAIKVPSGSVAAYKAASIWSYYADRISGIGE